MQPEVEVVLRGMALTSSEGNFAPCGVYLVRAQDAGGRPRQIVYDFAHAGRRPKLKAALNRRGVDPATVDTVVLSHAHWDHIQNVDLFPAATVLVHADELAYLADPHPNDHATPAWSKALLDTVNVRACAGDEELAPGVRLLHLPGHTPGSMGVAVETATGVAVLSGDALASAADAVAGQCPNVFWDPEQADASIRRVAGLAEVIYPGHDRPFRLAPEGIDYQAPVRPVAMSIGAVPPEDVTVIARQRSATRNLIGRAAEAAAAPTGH